MYDKNTNSVNNDEEIIRCHSCSKEIKKSEAVSVIHVLTDVETLKEIEQGEVSICSACKTKIDEDRKYRRKILFTGLFYSLIIALITFVTYFYSH